MKQTLIKTLAGLLAISACAMAQDLPTAPSSGYDTGGRYPSGSINTISYYSSVAGRNVDMQVYTPPGYNPSQKYGVVYAYQGIGTDIGTIFADWCVGAGIVCDNLIGEGKISKGVIIVAVDDQFNGDYSDVQGMTLNDVIPYIDSHYSTYADADHRGVYGFSWGGGYAFNVGCQNLNYFHHIGPSAAAPNKAGDDQLFPNGGAAFKQLQKKSLFFSWGEGDYDSIKSAGWNCHNYCSANGIPHSYWEVPGQGHTSGVWRPAMWNFLQLADRAGISGGGTTPGDGVTFYADYYYGGSASQALGAGSYTLSQLAAKGVVNDWASSVKVPSGYTVKMYQHDNFTGTCWTLTADQSELGSIGANDQVSSVVVELNITGTKKIVVRHSGKAMDAYGAQTGNGTQIIQWTYGGGANQQWTVTDSGSGNYKIIGVQSGKSLDVDYSSGGTANGTKVQLWDFWNGPSQQFKFAATDSGYYRITPNCATGSCLDVSGISTADGALVQLWQWNGGANQQWALQVP